MTKIILIAAFLTSTFLSCRPTEKSDIPILIAKLYRGDSINLQQSAKGKVLVLHTWSTFCGPCLAELRSIHSLFDRYKSNTNIKFLTIALNTETELDKFQSRSDTTTFYHWSFKVSKLDSFYVPTLIGVEKGYKVDKTSNSYSAYLQEDPKVDYLYKIFNSRAIPITMIFDKNGKLAKRNDGSETTKDGLTKQEQSYQHTIDSLLAL